MNEYNIVTVEKNNFRFHFIPTNKFKTITFVMKCKAPLLRETVTKRSLLSSVLEQGTETYRTEQQLQQKLDELYGATLQIDTMKKGNHHIIHIQLEMANEKFIPGQTGLTETALQLLFDIMFRPHVANESFPETVITNEKRKLQQKIESLYDHKIAYANERLIAEMYKSEPYATTKDGYIADFATIDERELYRYYRKLLTEDDIDMYVLGDFTLNDMEQRVTNLFQRQRQSSMKETTTDHQQTIDQPTTVIEKDTLHQAKLHLGYRTYCTFQDEQYSALQVFNGLFGGFPNSTLFMNVREKHSLAYYIASRIESHIGLLLVYSGVETSEYERTLNIINEQFAAIQQGEFTEELLTNIKQLIVSQLLETLDSSYGTIEWLYQQVIGERSLSPAQFIQQIEQVTKEDVIRIAQQIKLDTVYVLAGEEVGDSHG